MIASTASTLGEDRTDLLRLHRLMTAYLSSKAIFTAISLGVFDALNEEPHTVTRLADRLGLPLRPVRVILLALLGEGLVRREGDLYRNDRLASTFLVRTSPAYMGSFALHQDSHFAKMSQLEDALRGNRPIGDGAHAEGSSDGQSEWVQHLVQALHCSALLQARSLTSSVLLTGRRHLCDLACGSGAYSVAFARANNDLRVTAVDRPSVAAYTRQYVAEAGFSSRITVVDGDAFVDEFPQCDVVLMSHILEGYGRDEARWLVRHVYGWLHQGGEILIHAHLPSRCEEPFPYLMGLVLIANSPQGQVHEEAVITSWLEEAGFAGIRATTVSPISGVIRAHR